jgi:hypothetical protein
MDMDDQSVGPDEAFARDLEQLDRDLEQRQRPGLTAEERRQMIGGLIEGMRFVGRARDVHTAAERLAHESTRLPR